MSAHDRSAGSLLLWCASGFVAAIVVGWLAAWIYSHGPAPVGITSIVIGIALGAALGALAINLRVVARPTVVRATILLALIAVLAQHGWLYREFRRQWQTARDQSPQIAMFREKSPWSPREYFIREATPQRVALWCADAVLIAAPATGTLWMLRRRTQLDSASRPTPISPSPDT